MSGPRSLLYLSDMDLRGCSPPAVEITDVVERAFRAKWSGEAVSEPQVVLDLGDSRLMLAKAGALKDPPFAAVKWLGVFPGNSAHGVPDFHPLILLNDSTTGMPLAVMDGRWITGVRTAAISAVAARHLARPDCETLGVVASGLQARTHLAAMRAEFPLKRVVCWSRNPAKAVQFAAEVRQMGLDAVVAGEPRDAVAGADIVVSVVADVPDLTPFLSAEWLSRGSFVSFVDLGRPWVTDSLAGLDKVVTDDMAQSTADNPDRVAFGKPFYADLSKVVAGEAQGRMLAQERNGINFNGIGITDAAVAGAFYLRARAAGLGVRLPL